MTPTLAVPGQGARLFGDVETFAQLIAELTIHLGQDRLPVAVGQGRFRNAERSAGATQSRVMVEASP